MLRLTRLSSARLQHTAVVGAEIPVFRRFPYKANDILHLYKDFWRLILRFPENERHDLIFKLRNEFRSKRHMGHPRLISKAFTRGQALLEMYKGRVEYSESLDERKYVSRVGAAELRKERALFDASVIAESGWENRVNINSKKKRKSEPAELDQKTLERQIRSNILCLDDDEDEDDAPSSSTKGLGVYGTTINCPQRAPLTGTTSGMAKGGSNSVNTLWEQIQQSTHSTIPNLRHYRYSKQTEGKRPSTVNHNPYVPSR